MDAKQRLSGVAVSALKQPNKDIQRHEFDRLRGGVIIVLLIESETKDLFVFKS